MSGSTLKKFILTPVLISASIFAALTLPLGLFGNQQVTIKMQGETTYDGKLRDVATPYLGFAGLFSLGAGIVSVAIAGWQHSSRKSEAVEAQLSGLAQHLQEKEAQLEALKLSESRLEASGLKAFLDEEDLIEASEPMPVTNSSLPLVVEEYIMPPPAIEVQVIPPVKAVVPATTAKFACAQSFLGYAHGKAAPKPMPPISTPSYQDMEQLQSQLQHLMIQMASMQAALAATDRGVQYEPQPSENVTPLQVAKAWSVHRKIV
jgi:hypothetical protein